MVPCCTVMIRFFIKLVTCTYICWWTTWVQSACYTHRCSTSAQRRFASGKSTNQLRCKPTWLLKGMWDGTLIGLLHVTPKTHLYLIDLLSTKPLILWSFFPPCYGACAFCWNGADNVQAFTFILKLSLWPQWQSHTPANCSGKNLPVAMGLPISARPQLLIGVLIEMKTTNMNSINQHKSVWLLSIT